MSRWFEKQKPISILIKDHPNLPEFVVREGSALWIVDGEKKEGPFDYVFDFGSSRDWMRTKTRYEIEWNSNNKIKGPVCFLAFDKPLIERHMAGISELVNNPGRSGNNPTDRAEYRHHLRIVYAQLAQEMEKRIGLEETLIFAPKPAGILIEEAFKQPNFSQRGFFDYRLKRIQRETGELTVGIKLGKTNPDIKDYDSFVLFFDCLATDVSVWSTLELIRERVDQNSLLKTRILVVSTAASQRCLEHLISGEVLNYFGFGTIEALAATPVFHEMNKHYDLVFDWPKDRLAVGNMSEWTRV